MRRLPVPALLLSLALLCGLAPAGAQVQRGSPSVPGVAVSAFFATENKPITSGIVWRVLREDLNGGPATIVARSTLAAPVFALEPGAYLVNASYGFASGSKRINVPPSGNLVDRVSLSAGALKLAGIIGDRPIPASAISFSVFVPLAGNSEGRLVADNIKSGQILRLPEGTYHVVSIHGDANAIRRADVKVESGKLVEATLHHRAAKATLKLVAAPGGEAFAGTAFTVLTPGGDVIREAIGAFPEVILSEGEYVLIARQGGQVHTHEFKIEAGFDRDIEVVVGR
ncbi:MAG: hypothetical protein NTZ14_07065 [Hyphomicrobiales bacterium]|nr:hypothetical protein [Hyphomicrobiales bacterium]